MKPESEQGDKLTSRRANASEGMEPFTARLREETARWARTWCLIDLPALRRNLRRVHERLAPGRRLIVSAKKDGYGHGLLAVAGEVDQLRQWSGRDITLGLMTIEEPIALREAGYDGDLLLFTTLAGEALGEAIRLDAALTITDLEDARAADEAAGRLGKLARVHLKVDTGMGRLGRRVEELPSQIARIRALPNLSLESVWTHLANPKGDPESARRQIELLEGLRRMTGLLDLPAHLGGSDAVALIDGQAGGDYDFRAGISIYGDSSLIAGLEPVMTFVSHVIYRKHVPPDWPISYGQTHRTVRETELALIGAGYGNGVLRTLGNRGHVLLRGRRCPILGRICMDQFMVDVTECCDVQVGDEAVLFGRQGSAVLTAAEAARAAGTVSYELLCLAGQINPRRYRHAD